jgi:anti-sigma B factor antagonist
MFEIAQSTTRDGVVLLSLRGRLDAIAAPDIRPTIDALVAQRAQRVVCELGQLTMIDSSGVGAIVSLFKRLRTLGGDVKLAGLQGQPQEIFHLLRLDRVFEVFPSAQAAAESF